MLNGRILVTALFFTTACSESGGGLLSGAASDGSVATRDIGGPDTGSDAGEAQPDAGSGTDSGQPKTGFGIRIFDMQRNPAADALVYSVEDRRGTLLGRADATGFFALEAGTSFLARRGFDQVVRGEFEGNQNQDVWLEPVANQPETLTLRNVGLQTEFSTGRVSRVWARRQGGFVYSDVETDAVGLWVWTKEDGAQRRLTVPFPTVGALEAINELDDGVWFLVRGRLHSGGSNDALIADLNRGTITEMPGIDPSALEDFLLPRAILWQGNVLLFQPGQPIRVHRFNLAQRALDVVELNHDAELLNHVGFIGGQALLGTQDWFLRVDLDRLTSTEVQAEAPGRRIEAGSTLEAGQLRSATLDPPNIHWWTTARPGFVSFDLGAFEEAHIQVVHGSREGMFAEVYGPSYRGRVFWLDAATGEVVPIRELRRENSFRRAWGIPRTLGDSVEIMRPWNHSTISPPRIAVVDGANQVRIEDDFLFPPEHCMGALGGRSIRPTLITCVNSTETWVSSQHDGAWYRRSFFGDERGPSTVGSQGHVAFTRGLDNGNNLILDVNAPY